MNSLVLILTKLRYFAPAWVFACLNIMVSTWVLYIPRVKEKLAIDDAQLGVALFCFALGTLTMIPLSSFIIGKLGVGKATLIGVSVFCILFLFPVSVSTYGLLCLALYCTGLFACLTDISMNALVSEIEQEDNAHIMSASHGFFSLGGVLGAGIGSLLITYFRTPFYHMLGAAVGVLLTNIIFCKAYLFVKGGTPEKKKSTFDFELIRPLLGLTVIAFLIMGSEGAIEHWSTLYLKDIVFIDSERISGMGFFTFSAMMTLGRFLGDGISRRFGSLKIVMYGCVLGALGFLTILSANLYLTIIGFGLVGIGFSVVVPELFRLAGKTKGVSAAKGISFVAGFGYVGFLVSPPFLGFLSKLSSLKLSFTALLIGTLIALSITFWVYKRRQKTG